MKRIIVGLMCMALATGSTSCAAPVMLGAAVVGAGAGAQAGWWFGKKSKKAAEEQAAEGTQVKEDKQHETSASR